MARGVVRIRLTVCTVCVGCSVRTTDIVLKILLVVFIFLAWPFFSNGRGAGTGLRLFGVFILEGLGMRTP